MKTKWFNFILGFLFMLTGCTAGESPQRAEESSGGSKASRKNYLTLLPEMTNILIYANLDELRETPLGSEVRGEIWKEFDDDEDADYREFVAETGFDPDKDLHEVWAGVIHGDRGEDYGGAILSGRFDEQRIVQFVRNKERRKFDEGSFRGHKIYIIEDRDNEPNEFTFIDSETVVLGHHEWLVSILTRIEDGGGSVLDNKTMAARIADIPYKKQLWGVFNLDEISNKWADRVTRGGSSFRGTESIKNMKSVLFYTEIHDRAKMHLTGDFGNEEEAELLAETLNGLKAMAKLMVSDDREAIDMLNDIKIKSDGATLSISTNFHRDFFEKFEEKRRKFGDNPGKLL